MLAEKERPPPGLKGGWAYVRALLPAHHVSLQSFLFISDQPTPMFKEGRALSLAPDSHHLSTRLQVCDRPQPGTWCGASLGEAPSD